MERAYRISNLWNWLPAFRLVAETEHLPTAARALHVSPSALSRSVKHLENEIGQPLFERDGRRMKLNRAGAQLLVAVRDAMRRIDDGLEGAVTATSIPIAGPAEWLRLIVLPALAAALVPGGVCVDIVECQPADSERALLSGEVDLVVSELDLVNDQLVVVHLGASPHVLCGRRVAGQGERAACDDLPLAIWTGAAHVWAPRDSCEVALRTPHLALVIDACRAGRVRAVMPLALARNSELDVVRPVPMPPAEVNLVRRRPLAASRIDELVDRIRAQATRVLDRARSLIKA